MGEETPPLNVAFRSAKGSFWSVNRKMPIANDAFRSITEPGSAGHVC